jgi:hypothetical protein
MPVCTGPARLSRQHTTAKEERQKNHYELAFVFVGLIGVAAIVWSGYRSSSVQDTIKEGVDKIVTVVVSKPQQQETEDAKLFLQCDWGAMPKVMPASGEIFIVEPHSSTPSLVGMSGIGRQFGPPGSPLVWTPEGKEILAFGHRCKLFNYGPNPIFDVILKFDALIRAVKINDGGGKQSGDVLNNDKVIVQIAKVDQGQDNAFTFYFFNRFSPYFLQIEPTPSASFVKSNNSPLQLVTVISSEHQPLFLNPAEIDR